MSTRPNFAWESIHDFVLGPADRFVVFTAATSAFGFTGTYEYQVFHKLLPSAADAH